MTKTKEYREKQTSKEANMLALVPSLRIPEPYLLLNNPDTFLLFGEGRLLINLPRNLLSIPKFSSVAQLCPTSCSPKNCGTPDSSVHHQLPWLAQTQLHWVGNWLNLILCHLVLLLPSIFPSTGVVFKSQFFASGGQNIVGSALT